MDCCRTVELMQGKAIERMANSQLLAGRSGGVVLQQFALRLHQLCVCCSNGLTVGADSEMLGLMACADTWGARLRC